MACVGFNFDTINFIKYFKKYYYCYIIDIISITTWSIYSVIIKKYSNMINDDYIPLCTLLTGILCIIISLAVPGYNNYNHFIIKNNTIPFLLYESIIVSCLSYYFWNIAVRFGNIAIANNFSLLGPIFNIIITSLCYDLKISYDVIYGALILIVALILSKISIVESDT